MKTTDMVLGADGKIDVAKFAEAMKRLGFPTGYSVVSQGNGVKLIANAPSEFGDFGGVNRLQCLYPVLRRIGFKVRWIVSPEKVDYVVTRHEGRVSWPAPNPPRPCLNQECPGNCTHERKDGIREGSPMASFAVSL